MSDLSFQYVAGVHEVGGESLPSGPIRRNLLTHEPEPFDYQRAWEAISENDESEDLLRWRHAGRRINELLVDYLEELQNRCSDESISNPIVEGVINSHKVDIVGENGPRLQIEPIGWDGRDWADRAEEVWCEVAEAPTADGEQTLGDWLATGVEEFWGGGGTIDQVVNDPDARHPIKTRLHPIEIRRLQTPAWMTEGTDVVLGIERNRFGRPVRYHIIDELDIYGFATTFVSPRANQIIHCYQKRKTGQLRGIPWMAGALAPITELRKFDQAVMDVAQVATMMHIFMYSMSELVDTPSQAELEAPVKLKRRGVIRIPAHHQLDALQSNQPLPHYAEFRHERSRDLGRPVSMPQLTVQNDASGHNYSSARFDDKAYSRAIRRTQAWIARRKIEPYLRLVFAEAIERGILPAPGGKYRLIWQWDVRDGVDPVKEEMGRMLRRENFAAGPLTTSRECGHEFENVIHEIEQAAEMIDRAKLDDELKTFIKSALAGAAKTGGPMQPEREERE